MNGKQAKRLRRMAAVVVVKTMKVKLSDGFNKYNQAMNCLGWTNQVGDDGIAMKDPEGQFLKTLEKKPGTLTCAWKFRVMYQALKAQWKSKAHNRKAKQNVVG
jgi:hypothetical protein